MKMVSMLEFRHHAEKIIAQVQKGQPITLTRRGKPVARLVPILDNAVEADDPFYSLAGIGDATGEALTNKQIDDIVYGQ